MTRGEQARLTACAASIRPRDTTSSIAAPQREDEHFVFDDGAEEIRGWIRTRATAAYEEAEWRNAR